ncbi:MAG: GGDEF domain-containing protein [Lachnospiraceae bacterium]|nr:GGDEF domain-containing protein [Lachnospiraceae bacterium]
MSDVSSITDYVFSKVEEGLNADLVIMDAMERVGNLYGIDNVSVKEVTDPVSHTFRCTYVWDVQGDRDLLNLEKRYETQAFEEFKLLNTHPDAVFKVFEFHEGEADVPRHLVCAGMKSMLRIPLLQDDEFCGYVDFVDKKNASRSFDPEEISQMKNFSKLMLMYLLPLREKERIETESKDISEFDPLTRLLKYEVVYHDLEKIINDGFHGSRLDFISFDFTNFKFINEKYGYNEGNRILCDVAEFVYSVSGYIIACCRPYSDNFFVVIKVPETKSTDHVRMRLENAAVELIDELRKRFFDCNLIVNCGIFSLHGDKRVNTSLKKAGLQFNASIETALFNANLARKFAKRESVNSAFRCLMYDKRMSVTMEKYAEYISSMKKALERDEFFFQLQPKFTSDTKEIVGAEALVRWKKDGDEILYPDDFLSVFEENGCIVDLDYDVYEQVFAYVADRLKKGLTLVPVSVNVSIIHFYSLDLLKEIDRLMEKYGVDTDYIEFELSEKIYISDFVGVRQIIEGLKRRGFRVYLDGFGSGYSSLNTLTKYQIDGIMLDRKFMKEKLEYKDKIVISCMVDMANRLGLQVFCEGVENEEQRQFLIKNDCPYIQGNLFSPPVDVAKFDRMLEKKGI